MKPWKLAVALAASAAVLTGAYLLISFNKKQADIESSASEAAAESIIKFNSSDLSELIITNSDGEFGFKKNDNQEWITADNSTFNFNQFMLNDIVNYMSVLNSTGSLGEASDLSVYGLDDPVSVIECIMSDSTSYVLEIGNTAISGNEYYVKRGNDNNIYTVSSDIGETLATSKNTLKDTYMFYAMLKDVDYVKLQKASDVVYEIVKKDDGSWTMTLPIENDNANIANISDIIDQIIHLNLVSYVAENPTEAEYSEFGLDQPSYVLDVRTADKSRKIVFGRTDEKTNQIYAMFDDTKDVVLFDKSSLSLLDNSSDYVLVGTIHTEKIYDVSKVDVLFNGEKTTLEMETEGDSTDNAKYTYNGTKINTADSEAKELFEAFYSSITGVYIDHVEVAEPSGEPAIQFVYTRKTAPETVTVSFIQKEENSYYAMVDGKYTGCVVRLKTFYDDRGFVKTKQALEDYLNNQQ